MTKIEVGKTYLTQNGRSVRIIATDRMGEYPIVGLLFERNRRRESVQFWTAEGLYHDGSPDHGLNIFIPSERKSRWVNWYGPNGGDETRWQADLNAGDLRTHVFEVITEDGKPVDVKIHEVSQDRATQGEG